MSIATGDELSFCIVTNGVVDTLHGDPVISVYEYIGINLNLLIRGGSREVFGVISEKPKE